MELDGESTSRLKDAVPYEETLNSSKVKRCIHACTMYVTKHLKNITKSGWSGVRSAFEKHPSEVKQTYYEHFKETAKHAGRKLKEACALITHAILPFAGTHVSYATYTPKPKVSTPLPVAPEKSVSSQLYVSDRVLDALELATMDMVRDTERIRAEIVEHQGIKQALQEAMVAVALQGSNTPKVLQNVEKWE